MARSSQHDARPDASLVRTNDVIAKSLETPTRSQAFLDGSSRGEVTSAA
jgi:hypothetical protein